MTNRLAEKVIAQVEAQMSKQKETCSECDSPIDWIRHTQFSGDHPYCEKHARQQSDFGEEDSYTYWEHTRNTAFFDWFHSHTDNGKLLSEQFYNDFPLTPEKATQWLQKAFDHGRNQS